MKFKKEDLGLYFAFALVGGGLGLLAGVILTNWLEKRAQEEAADEELAENEVADDDWAMIEKERREVELIEAETSVFETIKDEEDYEPKEMDIDEKPEKKRNERRPNKSQYTDEELEEFFAEYSPNVMMMEMLRNGGMTIEQVIGVIEAEEEALDQEPVDYNKPYHEVNVEEAEEEGNLEPEKIEELIQELGIVNDRFQILTGPPHNAGDLLHKEIQWDPEDNSFYMLRREAPIIYDIRTSIGHDTWEVIEPYLLRGLSKIYVVDLEKPRYYSFHKLAGLGEDDPAEHGSE